MRSVRRWALLAAVVVVLLTAGVLALALTATPASAFQNWAHDGAMGCSCHDQGQPTNATCEACHTGFQSYPDKQCWSCHAPGQDTEPLSTPSSACSQECHLWDPVQKQYITPTTHGSNPHLGSSAECLACHQTSVNIIDPGSSPHHSGQATGFSSCGTCHSSPQKHAGKVACTSCHTDAQAFHLFEASSPGFKKCGSCHTMRHAGVKVATSRCAPCHKGNSGPRGAALQSSHQEVRVQRLPHQEAARQRRQQVVKNCRTCHRGRYHAAQRTPGKSVCTGCHSIAKRHDNGFACTLCHRRAVHAQRPSPVNL